MTQERGGSSDAWEVTHCHLCRLLLVAQSTLLQCGAVCARAQSPRRQITEGGLGGWLPRGKKTRCSQGSWRAGSHTNRWLHSPRFALESSSLGAGRLSWPHARQLDCHLTSGSPPCLAVSPPRRHTGPHFPPHFIGSQSP